MANAFEQHNINANHRGLLIGAARRNDNGDMDAILNQHYNGLGIDARVALKNYAQAQAQQQGIVVGNVRRGVRGNVIGANDDNGESPSVFAAKIFTIIALIISCILGVIKCVNIGYDDKSPLWSIIVACILILFSLFFWFFAVFIPNMAHRRVGWARNACIAAVSLWVITHFPRLMTNFIAIPTNNHNCGICPSNYPNTACVYGCCLCMRHRFHPAQWLFFELCLRRIIMAGILSLSFWDISLFVGFHAILVITISLGIDAWLITKELCIAQGESDSLQGGPPIRFSWFGPAGTTIHTYNDYERSAVNIFVDLNDTTQETNALTTTNDNTHIPATQTQNQSSNE